MRILVDEDIPCADQTFGQHGQVDRFRGRDLRPSDLRSVKALITRSVTRVDAELLSDHRPEFIGTCTAGIDHLDAETLEAHGISWAFAPGSNAQSVVDYVFAATVALRGDWLPQSAGVVGCGNIGGRLRATLCALGVRVHVHDPFLQPESLSGLTSLEEVFASELVCLHTPYTTDGQHPTSGMVDASLLQLLPRQAVLINAGRGGVVQEMALQQFLAYRPDVDVVMDVWAGEPAINADLMESVAIATPHIAGYSSEGRARATEQVYAAFCDCFGFTPVRVECTRPQATVTDDLGYVQKILAVYDPRVDSGRMRTAYHRASRVQQVSGSWFDSLRRDYPGRREIASFGIEVAGLPQS